MLFALGCTLLAVGRARRGQTSRMATPFAVLLACCALLSLGAIALGGLDPIRLHQGARGLPEATVFLVGLAGACWTWRQKALRYASLTAALAGAATTMLSTSVFLDAAGRDPFLVSAPVLEPPESHPFPSRSWTCPSMSDRYRSHHTANWWRRARRTRICRGEAPGVFRRPSRLRNCRRSTRLISCSLTIGARSRSPVSTADSKYGKLSSTRSRAFSRAKYSAGFRTGELRYRPADDRWIVLGHNNESRFVRAEGTPGVTGVRTSTWGPSDRPGGWLQAVGTKDAAALVVEERYRPGVLSRLARLGLATGLGRGYYTEIHINRVVNGSRLEVGRSLLEAGCDALETKRSCAPPMTARGPGSLRSIPRPARYNRSPPWMVASGRCTWHRRDGLSAGVARRRWPSSYPRAKRFGRRQWKTSSSRVSVCQMALRNGSVHRRGIPRARLPDRRTLGRKTEPRRVHPARR